MSTGPRFTLRLRAATIETREAGPVIVMPVVELPLDKLSAGVRAALLQLAGEGGSEVELVELVRAAGGGQGELAMLFVQLRVLELQLLRTLVVDGAPLVTVVPLAAGRRFVWAPPPETGVTLSRFSYLRRHEGALVLESPCAHVRVRIDDRRVAALIYVLVERGGARVDELAELGLLGAAAITQLLGTLVATGHLLAADDPREQQPPLATWSFHDLQFHVRSRVGRNDGPNGKTYPWRGKIDPLPAIEPRTGELVIELPRPDLETIAAADPAFTRVLESRRSIREHGQSPISLAQLGEFLYRAARVQRWAPLDPVVGYEFTTRPAPGGGACHELELYLAVDRCADLDAGLYHYDPLNHQLVRVAGRSPEFDALLADTKVATGGHDGAQVLICIAARFARMAWSYEGIAYAATLKNAGALIQTMYLVATAMGLAPCALGRGNADLFATLAGTDYYAQTTVAEFILGTRSASP